MPDHPTRSIVDYDRIGRATCCKVLAIVRKCDNPNFTFRLIQNLGRSKGKLVPIAYMIRKKRKWCGRTMIEASSDLVESDLIEELRKPVIWYHDGW